MNTSRPRRIASLRRGLAMLGLAGLLVGAALPARAQLGLPRLPNLPRELPRLPGGATVPLAAPVQMVQALRADTVRSLLRDHAGVLEADPAGEPMRRQELVVLSPPRMALEAALAQGFVLLREQPLQGLDLMQVVLRAPPGMGTADALARLRTIDAALDADFNHLYTRSGDTRSGEGGAAAVATATIAPPATAQRRVGLIDSGVDRSHAALRGVDVRTWGCDAQPPVPTPHGTAVASLLVGRDSAFSGTAPGAQLHAADIWCGQPTGGALEQLAAALAWMARERVAVVNVSLVGPNNRVLDRAVRALIDKGHLVVAAVGNDGPAAPPLYPASYAGVVGVTGVTTSRRVLPEAAQGAQVLVAAPGAELAVARPGGGYAVARGTSFAAPLVAGLLAEQLSSPDRGAAAAALARVVDAAQDLGTPGRDTVFGLGLVAERNRVAPERAQAALR
jgi:subtilisin family serine protease